MADLRVTRTLEAGISPWTKGLWLPNAFTFTVTGDPSVPYDLELDVRNDDGQVACTALRCRERPGGPAVTSEGLRAIPIARILRHAVLLAAVPGEAGPGGLVELTESDLSDPRLYEAARGVGRRRRLLDEEHLQEVAQVWRAAGASERTKAVAEHFFTSRQNARKWLAKAEELGLIDREQEDR